MKQEIRATQRLDLDHCSAAALTLYRIDVDISEETQYIEDVNRKAQNLGHVGGGLCVIGPLCATRSLSPKS